MSMSHPDAPGVGPGGEFSVARRGYSPVQVDEHLRYLHAQLSMLAADRDAMADQCDRLAGEVESARTEADQLRDRVRLLALHPLSAEGITERARLTLELATEEAEVVREGAQREARALVDRAAVEHRRNERERHRLERERGEIAAEHMEASQALASAHWEADRIIAETSASRDDSEQQLAASIAARWEEVEAEAERTEATHRVEAERVLAAARQQAEHVISQARHVAAGITRSAEDDRAEAVSVLDSAREAAERTAQIARDEAQRTVESARHAASDLIEQAQQRSDALSDLDIGTFSRLADLRGRLDDYIAHAGESPTAGSPSRAAAPGGPTWPPVIQPAPAPSPWSRGTASLPGLLPPEARQAAPADAAPSRDQVQGPGPGDEPFAGAVDGEQRLAGHPMASDDLTVRTLAPAETGEPVSTPASPGASAGSAHRFGGGRDLMWFLRYRNGTGR